MIDGTVKTEKEDRHGKDHLNDRHREFEGCSGPDEKTAVGEGIRRAEEQIPQKHDEVSVIVIAHAASGEHAMVIPLQDASVADIAVPGSRRREALADGTQPPSVRGFRRAYRHYVPLDAGVA